ncbi:MAG TPA: hypothetical protein VK157_11810 [Phycisphaerales bacterium]|nr:hypothetical protein [Phycisphaerales bacterium]
MTDRRVTRVRDVVAGLSMKWGMYTSHMEVFASEMHETQMVEDARYVMMPSE